jgi:hypothetical protein
MTRSLQATPEAALRVLYCAPSKQRVGSSSVSEPATSLSRWSYAKDMNAQHLK